MKKTIAIYLVTIQIAISGWSQGIVLSEGTVLNEHDVITGLEVPWKYSGVLMTTSGVLNEKGKYPV